MPAGLGLVDGRVDADSGDEKAEGAREAPRGGFEGEESIPGAGFIAGEVGEGVLDSDLPGVRAEDLHGIGVALRTVPASLSFLISGSLWKRVKSCLAQARRCIEARPRFAACAGRTRRSC